MNILINIILSGCISFFLAFFSIPYAIKIAFRFDIVDYPTSKLKTHLRPVPYLGGLAIFFSFFFTLCFFSIVSFIEIGFFLGLISILLLGLADDIMELTPLQKILGQSVSILFLVLPHLFLVRNSIDFLNVLILFFVMLLIINAYNLVDVMDGLASMIAISNFMMFLIISIICGQLHLSVLFSAVIGALVAFLFYNRPSARIYLGDSGSLFLGFFIGSVPLLFNKSYDFRSINFILGFISVIFVPLLEVFSLILIRMYKGLSPFRGSRDHFCIYLLNNNWNKSQVLGIAFLASVFWGSLGMYFIFKPINMVFINFIVTVFFIIWFYLVDIKNNVAYRSRSSK